MDYLNEVEEKITSLECDLIMRVEENHKVWDITYPTFFAKNKKEKYEMVEDLRYFIMEHLVNAEQNLFINNADDPIDDEVPGDWEQLKASNWKVPRSLSLDDEKTALWLSYGNWILYCAENSYKRWRDMHSLQASEVADFLKTNSIECFVASFHDDTAWRVALS